MSCGNTYYLQCFVIRLFIITVTHLCDRSKESSIDKTLVVSDMRTSTMVVLAALHIGWLKFLAVFLSGEKDRGGIKTKGTLYF